MDQEQEFKPQEPEAEVASKEEEPVMKARGEEKAEGRQESVDEQDLAHRKRGRMIAAGVAATVILSLIAILVAAIFQVTSKWLVVCPTDLPVNDPAPILWKTMVSESVTPFGLGVPEDILKEAGFKGAKSETNKAQAEKQE
jgi:hypothetical protein